MTVEALSFFKWLIFYNFSYKTRLRHRGNEIPARLTRLKGNDKYRYLMTFIKNIIVVGGGTAGWITAGMISAVNRVNELNHLSITLIESPDVPPIGVGEGTWPTMRKTLQRLGISETAFFCQCDVSFKQGAKFSKWVTGKQDDYYYHPLVLPEGFLQQNLAPYWMREASHIPFADLVSFQSHLCEKGLAPKFITTPEYSCVANYAYHLNSTKFSQFLSEHCIKHLNVNHILDKVTSIHRHGNGDIAYLERQSGERLEGDLFVDCTGFSSLLLGETLGVEFVSKHNILFTDTALAAQVEYESDNSPIASHTISTAQSAGWIWDIGLTTRKGVGHVFSSHHISEDQAIHELLEYISNSSKTEAHQINIRKIPIRSGHRRQFWKNNCVAVGLSAGFLEPLEASALVLVELSATMLAEQLPVTRQSMDIIAKRFNERFLYRWDRIIDFLKLHYFLTKRTDSQFWIDNTDPETVPDSLKELLALWEHQECWNYDFYHTDEVFPAASYQYVLYGMGFRQQCGDIRKKLTQAERESTMDLISVNARKTEKLINSLPSNRDLSQKIHKYGLQRI